MPERQQPEHEPSRGARLAVDVAAHLGSGMLGALVTVAAIGVSRERWQLLGVELPWGLVLAVAASASAGVFAWAALDRADVALSACVGWLLVVALGMAGRPEGDYVFAADLYGYGFLVLGFGSMLVLAIRAFVTMRTTSAG